MEVLRRHPEVPPIGGPEWKRVLRDAYGNELECLIARSPDGRPVGILAFHMARDLTGRRRMFSAPWGLVGEDDGVALELSRAATQIARQRGCVSAAITSGARFFPLSCRHRVRQTFVFDLGMDPETIWSGLRSQTRNSVRKGQKSGLEVVRGWAPLDDFYRVYSARMTAKAVPFHSLRYFQVAAEALGSRGEVFAAYRKGRVEAAMLVVYGREVASYNWGASNPGGASVQAGQFLLWEIVQACIARGLRLLDLGESSKGSGTHAFKMNFGARALNVHYYDLLSAKSNKVRERPPVARPVPGLSSFGRAEQWLVHHLPAVARARLLVLQRRGTRLF